MRVFKEYLLDEKNLADQTVYLPAESEVVNVLNTSRGLVLLAVVKHTGYEDASPEIRKFKICTSGEIFYTPTVKYIGSFESSLGIRHVIEVD